MTNHEEELADYDRRRRAWNRKQLLFALFEGQPGSLSITRDHLEKLEQDLLSGTNKNETMDQIIRLLDNSPVGKLYAANLIFETDEALGHQKLEDLQNDSTEISVLFDDFVRKITVGEAASAILRRSVIGFHPSIGKPYSPQEKQARDQEYKDKMSNRSWVEKSFDFVLRKIGF